MSGIDSLLDLYQWLSLHNARPHSLVKWIMKHSQHTSGTRVWVSASPGSVYVEFARSHGVDVRFLLSSPVSLLQPENMLMLTIVARLHKLCACRLMGILGYPLPCAHSFWDRFQTYTTLHTINRHRKWINVWNTCKCNCVYMSLSTKKGQSYFKKEQT